MKVLTNCRLVPELVEGYSGQMADIAMDGAYIEGIYPCGQAPAGESMDMKGNTVLPGLLELHVHANFDTMNIPAIKHRSDGQCLVDGLSYYQDYLRNGYTFIRECGVMNYQSQYLRQIIDKGLAMGPHIQTSGACNTPTTRGNEAFGNVYKEFDGADQALKIVREDMAHGCDFIKYMVTGAMMNEGGDPGAMICTKEELQAVVDAAAELGTYVACHCHGKKGILACLETGVGTIEHATYLDEECIAQFLAYGNRSALIPTMGIQFSMAENLAGNTPEYMQKKTSAIYMKSVDHFRKAYDAGVRIGWGADMDRPTFDLFPGLEFRARALMGLTPVQLLKMTTIDSAKIIHMDEKCGTIKAGKWADLVVIEGNPDEDISAMYKLPLHVFKEGKQFC